MHDKWPPHIEHAANAANYLALHANQVIQPNLNAFEIFLGHLRHRVQ